MPERPADDQAHRAAQDDPQPAARPGDPARQQPGRVGRHRRAVGIVQTLGRRKCPWPCRYCGPQVKWKKRTAAVPRPGPPVDRGLIDLRHVDAEAALTIGDGFLAGVADGEKFVRHGWHPADARLLRSVFDGLEDVGVGLLLPVGQVGDVAGLGSSKCLYIQTTHVEGPHRERWSPSTSCPVRHWRRIRDSDSWGGCPQYAFHLFVREAGRVRHCPDLRRNISSRPKWTRANAAECSLNCNPPAPRPTSLVISLTADPVIRSLQRPS